MATSSKESKANIAKLKAAGVPDSLIASAGKEVSANEYSRISGQWQTQQAEQKAATEQQVVATAFQTKVDALPDKIKNDPSFQALPNDQKEIVMYNYEVQKANDLEKSKALASALEQATAQADPYWKNIIRVAQDEVLRGIEEAQGDFASSVERQQRRIQEINQDLAANKDFLTLEQQSELANLSADLTDKTQTYQRNIQYLGAEKASQLAKLEAEYNKLVDDTNRNVTFSEAEKRQALETLARNFEVQKEQLGEGAANAGLTFSTKRKIAEQRLKAENTGMVESTQRQYNKQQADLLANLSYAQTQKGLQTGNIEAQTAYQKAQEEQSLATAQRLTESQSAQTQRQYMKQIADLQTEANRGNTEAQASISDLQRKLGESITGIGRSAEKYLGTEKVAGLPGYTPMGGVTGGIYEEQVADVNKRSEAIYDELIANSLQT